MQPRIPKPKGHASKRKQPKQTDNGSQILTAWFDRDVVVGLGGVQSGEHPGPGTSAIRGVGKLSGTVH